LDAGEHDKERLRVIFPSDARLEDPELWPQWLDDPASGYDASQCRRLEVEKCMCGAFNDDPAFFFINFQFACFLSIALTRELAKSDTQSTIG
jgi:hypothetical protein